MPKSLILRGLWRGLGEVGWGRLRSTESRGSIRGICWSSWWIWKLRLCQNWDLLMLHRSIWVSGADFIKIMDLGLLTYISRKSVSRRFSWCNSQLLTPSGRRAMKIHTMPDDSKNKSAEIIFSVTWGLFKGVSISATKNSHKFLLLSFLLRRKH